MTRRDFISKAVLAMRFTLILAFALISNVSFGIPIKSNISAFHQQFNVVEEDLPSASLYVQDGLVAIYDAIENVGVGLHDSYAQKWIDLVSGSEIDIAGCEVNKNNISIPSNGLISGMCSTLADNIYGSVEVLFKVFYKNSSVFYSGKRSFYMYDNNVGRSRTGFRMPLVNNTAYRQGEFTYRDWRNITLISMCGYTVWNKPQGFYIDSLIGNQSALTPDDAAASSEFIVYGGTVVYCIRIYDRTLTQEEVAENYAVDCLRFGL